MFFGPENRVIFQSLRFFYSLNVRVVGDFIFFMGDKFNKLTSQVVIGNCSFKPISLPPSAIIKFDPLDNIAEKTLAFHLMY